MSTSFRHHVLTTTFTAALAIVSIQCGGEAPPPKTPESAPEAATKAEPKAKGGEAFIGAEYGGMNETKVARAFERAGDALETCLDDGAQGMPYLGGTINFYLEVDTSGKVVHAHVEKSDLGDRSISKCMLDVLSKKTWPAPVGGARGKIQSGMTFSPSPGADKPTAWEAYQVATAVGELAQPIEECKAGVSGVFTATAYIGTYRQKPDPDSEDAKDGPVEVGKIMAVDVAPPDKEGAAAIDCIVKVLRTGTYPSPGELPAKVTFPL